jgi:hypothetical protein
MFLENGTKPGKNGAEMRFLLFIQSSSVLVLVSARKWYTDRFEFSHFISYPTDSADRGHEYSRFGFSS